MLHALCFVLHAFVIHSYRHSHFQCLHFSLIDFGMVFCSDRPTEPPCTIRLTHTHDTVFDMNGHGHGHRTCTIFSLFPCLLCPALRPYLRALSMAHGREHTHVHRSLVTFSIVSSSPSSSIFVFHFLSFFALLFILVWRVLFGFVDFSKTTRSRIVSVQTASWPSFFAFLFSICRVCHRVCFCFLFLIFLFLSFPFIIIFRCFHFVSRSSQTIRIHHHRKDNIMKGNHRMYTLTAHNLHQHTETGEKRTKSENCTVFFVFQLLFVTAVVVVVVGAKWRDE